MRKTREETLRSRLADLASQIEQLDKARAETKAMLDVLVGLPPEQRSVLEGYLEKVNPTPDPEEIAKWFEKYDGKIQPMPPWYKPGTMWHATEQGLHVGRAVDDHYPLGK